jgi:RNA-binding protein PNO1
MNIKNKSVEIRSSKHTTEPGAVQKAEDFIKAYAMGFDVDDAIALIRLDGVGFLHITFP